MLLSYVVGAVLPALCAAWLQSDGIVIPASLATRKVTLCKEGHGYPPSCPRRSDPDGRTRCCRHVVEPMCCLERASTVCMWQSPTGYRIYGNNTDPPLDAYAVFCPGSADPFYYDQCCWQKFFGFCCSRYMYATYRRVETWQYIGGLGAFVVVVLAVLGVAMLFIKQKISPQVLLQRLVSRSVSKKNAAGLSQADAGHVDLTV